MASDGFGFFYEKLGLSIDDLAFHYNFTQTGANVPVYSGNSFMSGRIDNLPNFWDQYGSGYFQSGGINVSGYSSLRDDNWTLLAVPQKLSTRSEVLFSTLNSGLSSGLVVSFNSLNDLVVTTKDSNGYLFSESFDLPLSNKNILAVTKAGNTVTCFSYDPSSLSYNSSSRAFPASCLLNNFEDLYIGKTLAGTHLPFSGYIDDVALIGHTINGRQFEVLSSGFMRTGYHSALVESTGLSFGSAHCNESGYVTGWNPSLVYTTVETESSIDFTFMKTLMKSGIKYGVCAEIDSFYGVGFKADPIQNVNVGIFFDAVNGYFSSEESWNFGDTLFFYDGLLQNKTSDYTYSSRQLIKSGSSYLAQGVLDAIPHEYSIEAFVSGDLTSGSVATVNNGNSILFLNGSILISGLDYTSNAGNFEMLTNEFSSNSGNLVEIKFTESEIDVNFTYSKFMLTGYHDDYFMAFIDRKRKPINYFSRMSSVETDFGTGELSCISGDLIYGNEGNYLDE